MSEFRHRFTLCTPTFNRAHLLHRVHDSLKAQTFKDFEWVLVDDGSTDGTRALVEGWMAEPHPFPIRYFQQEHGHKKTAVNRGVREAKGELLLTVDSDDPLLPDCLEAIDRAWAAIPEAERPSFAGVSGLVLNEKGGIIGRPFPQDVLDSDFQGILYRHGWRGMKWSAHRVDVLRKFPYPEDIPERVDSSTAWSDISREYRMRYINRPLKTYFHEPDSITKGGSTLTKLRVNCEGMAHFSCVRLANEWRWCLRRPLWFLKTAANNTRAHLHLRSVRPGRTHFPKPWGARLLVLLAAPLGVAVYLYDITLRKK
jgi:glycosyltransferase involved in cell wall biosynthesis